MSVLLLTMGPQLGITADLPVVGVGGAGVIRFRAIGAVGPVKWTLVDSTLPAEWDSALNPDGDAVTLTTSDAETPGTFSVTVRAVDSARIPVVRSFDVRVMALPLTITGAFPAWEVGVPATGALTISGGVPPYSGLAITSGALPDGVSLSIVGNQIVASGTPAAEGSGSVTIWVRDSDGAEGAIALSWSASSPNQVGFVAVSGTAIVTSTTMQVGRPSGVAVGDRLLATIMHRSALTPPAGWTLVRSDACSNDVVTQYLAVYSRVADAGDVVQAFYAWGQAASDRMQGVISAWRGDHSTPIVTSVGGHSTSNDTGPQNNRRTLYPAAAQSGSICVACATSILAATGSATSISVYGDQLTLISSAVAENLRVAVVRGDYVSADDVVQFNFAASGNNGTAASTVRLS